MQEVYFKEAPAQKQLIPNWQGREEKDTPGDFSDIGTEWEGDKTDVGSGSGWKNGVGWGGGSKRAPVQSEGALRISASGALMCDSDGGLLHCRQECASAPALFVQIEATDTEAGKHSRCIQINLEYSNLRSLFLEPEKTLKYELWPEDEDGWNSHYAGRFPLPEPGEELSIKASWQRGHHDINRLSRLTFKVCGVEIGIMSIARGAWRTIAVITIDSEQRIFVNGVPGYLPGGKNDLNGR